jgi:hypothetical protein
VAALARACFLPGIHHRRNRLAVSRKRVARAGGCGGGDRGAAARATLAGRTRSACAQSRRCAQQLLSGFIDGAHALARGRRRTSNRAWTRNLARRMGWCDAACGARIGRAARRAGIAVSRDGDVVVDRAPGSIRDRAARRQADFCC